MLEPDDRLTAALPLLHHDLFRYHFRLSQRALTPSRAYHQERRRQDRHSQLRVIGHSLFAPKSPQMTMSKWIEDLEEHCCTVYIQRALRMVGRTIIWESLGTHVVYQKYMGRAPLSVGQRLLEYKGDGPLEAIISSSFLQQAATFFSSGVNNKTLAKEASRSGFLRLLRCTGTPSYGSSKAVGVDWGYSKIFAYHACQSFGNRTYSLSQHLSCDGLGNSFACPIPT
jgi:hypothetical protein